MSDGRNRLQQDYTRKSGGATDVSENSVSRVSSMPAISGGDWVTLPNSTGFAGVSAECLSIGTYLTAGNGDEGDGAQPDSRTQVVAWPTFTPVPAKKPLGNTHDTTQPPPLLDRWEMQDNARQLLPDDRVSFCLRNLKPTAGQVLVVQQADGSPHYANLMVCGSVWVCPICAARISEHRRDELQQAVDKARSLGYTVYMFTQTCRHRLGQSLDLVATGIQQARRLMRNRKVWKRLSKKWELLASVRAQEVTVGDNGWHVHFHELLITKGQIEESDQAEIAVAWADACETAGLERPNEHGVDIRQGEKVDQYVSKWGLADEITGATEKDGRSRNVTPWGLLRLAAAGNDRAATLFREYARVMKGRHQLVWSKGMAALLGLNEPKTDEEIAQEAVQVNSILCEIKPLTWRLIQSTGLRGVVLRTFRKSVAEGHRLIDSLYCDGP